MLENKSVFKYICTGTEVIKTVTDLKILYDQVAGCFQELNQSPQEVTNVKWPAPEGNSKYIFTYLQSVNIYYT